MPDPYFKWCVAPGVARKTTLNVDTVPYGDGYVHRSTRGLNPARPAWDVAVPFTSLAMVEEIDTFMATNSATGFWFRPPDSSVDVFVTCDEWSTTVNDKSKTHNRIGVFSATFSRSFNPQP